LSKKVNVVVVGAGPAGLFCAEELLSHGVKDILIIDSGKSMSDRKCPQSQTCDCPSCDILEGVGGAGGFSDGKMTLSLGRGTQTEPIFSEEHEPLLTEVDHMMVDYGGEGNYFNPEDTGVELSNFRESLDKCGFDFQTYRLRHIGSDGAQAMIKKQEMMLKFRGVDFLLNTTVDTLLTNPIRDRVIGGLTSRW